MDRCLEPGEVAAVLDLAETDPRRRHLQDCARCRALAAAWAEFEAPSAGADLAGLAAADAELQGRLDTALAPRRRRLRPLWLAAAAVLAAAAIGLTATDLLRLRDGRLEGRSGFVRGDGEAAGLVCAERDDGLHLSWPEQPASDEVVVIFFDAAMVELGRRPAAGTTLFLASDDPLAAARYCQALHLAEGDVVARSAVIAARPARE